MKSLKSLFIAIVILVTASPVFAGYTFTEKPSMFPVYPTISSSLYNRKPVFIDLDNDGDKDLVVGCNDGSLKYLENTGTAASPAWSINDAKFQGISVTAYSAPTFADLDGDGDMDLIIGDLYGNFKYYKNVGTKTNPIFSYDSSMFAGITVGSKASPTFADLDDDGDLDMIVGDTSSIKYYQNTGTATVPAWPLVPANLSGVSPWTNNSPTFADMDNDGDFDLILACRGGLYYYKNTGNKNSPTWSSDWSAISGIYASYSDDNGVAIADLDNDGDNDILLGAGDFNYYLNIGSASAPSWVRSTPYILGFDVGSWSTPAFADINNDGLQDVYIGNSDGLLTCFINKGTKTNPAWAIDNTKVAPLDVGNYAAPAFADLDGDGKQDLIIGEYYGELKYFKNTGTATSPCWTADNNLFLGIDAGSLSAPTFADLDGDGDLDLVIGEDNGGIKYFKNVGTKTNPSWQSETNLFSSVNAYYYGRPSFVDIDNDGDLDLIVGNWSGALKFYENTGTAADPKFKENSSMFPGSSFGSDVVSTFVDIDDDGTKEAVIGNYDGTLACYDISFADTTGPEINTAYYEMTGVDGKYTISWDPASDSSGISCYELQESTSYYGSYTTLSNNITATSFQITGKSPDGVGIPLPDINLTLSGSELLINGFEFIFRINSLSTAISRTPGWSGYQPRLLFVIFSSNKYLPTGINIPQNPVYTARLSCPIMSNIKVNPIICSY